MANHGQQDAFMDESDDTCPLCVEEFDISDRNFKPCPCGYQVCQFCYNNIKNNMNGLCPACRRPYDDKTIEWKVVSPEEFKADVAAQARKKAVARQKEAERRQVETLNRKHLAGLRVLQKNLVYVMGMDTGGSDEDVTQTLKGPQHFGQYGKILKLATSKAKEGYGGYNSIGVYVTFANKEDAKTCIEALDGKMHDGRPLRAQYGTTKYCSAFLRNETCNNRGCTFLHETGEDSDSFSRQDLSSLNAISTQRPAHPSAAASSSKPAHQSPRPSQAHLPTSTAHNSAFQAVKTDNMSRSNSGDGSALPTTASWAKNPQVEQSRRSSQAPSRATPSPKVANAKLSNAKQPEPTPGPSTTVDSKSKVNREASREPKGKEPQRAKPPEKYQPPSGLEEAAKIVAESNWTWSLDPSLYDDATLAMINNFPPLIDPNGGAVRYEMKRRQEQDRASQPEEASTASPGLAADEDENFASGSLQLGGEPETNEDANNVHGHPGGGRRNLANQAGFGAFAPQAQPFDGQVSLANDFSNLAIGRRSLTPQQQRNMALLKSSTQLQDSLMDSFQRGHPNNQSQHQSQLSNPFQAQNQQLSALSRHGRHASRYTFANDSLSASTAVKPSTNNQLMAQQATMMPQSHQKQFSQNQIQSGLHTNFYSGVQGPPPGLKSSGTPPISGGGMFAQGHGFASSMGGNAGFGGANFAGKNVNDDLRDVIRGRTGGNGPGAEPGKREFNSPSFSQEQTYPLPHFHGWSSPRGNGSPSFPSDRFAMKPKKKGKKHRHANTSSSGGGAIVDLADPSILQARMHQAGAGQGHYSGGQPQGGYSSHNMMYGGGHGGRW